MKKAICAAVGFLSVASPALTDNISGLAVELFVNACLNPDYSYTASPRNPPLPEVGEKMDREDASGLAPPGATDVAGWWAFPASSGLPDIAIITFVISDRGGCIMTAPDSLSGDDFASSFGRTYSHKLTLFRVESSPQQTRVAWAINQGVASYGVDVLIPHGSDYTGFIARSSRPLGSIK